ncbi:streptomycin biosynthesis protein [Kitasatospora sp. NPDC057015]|uniref:streptomycin biosynthesis protein n=1 Tax=Kitasatospora sp. NPDC057015 TaxID=3346001 RepID=UPI0036450172
MEIVPVGSLLPADSPRSEGEDVSYAQLLAHSGATLPPIIVHRPTMRVVDGMHRLRAAVARGEEVIRARYFEGAARDAFLIAVRENTAHGLPLSLSDRRAAAVRIIGSHGHWSDRAIAGVVGLSARTVSEIRRVTPDETTQPTARLGRDGKLRPVNSSQGRILAGRLIAEMPGASLRQIAQIAKISPGTVRDVRARLSRGEDPVPDAVRRTMDSVEVRPQSVQRSASVPRPVAEAKEPPEPAGNPLVMLGALLKDPSLKYVEHGRFLLRLLGANALPPDRWEEMIEVVPEHSAALVSQVARGYAGAWLRFAEGLERNG